MTAIWIAFAVFLYVACAILLVIEIFVPSFGLLTVLAIVCGIGGGGIFFRYGLAAGWVGVGTAAVVIPVVWIIAFRLFPRTRFGKAVIMARPDRSKGDAIPDNEQLQSMLNRTGTVVTTLRPVGMCDFDGRRIECVAERGFVTPGNKIKVIRVEGTQLTVRLLEEA